MCSPTPIFYSDFKSKCKVTGAAGSKQNLTKFYPTAANKIMAIWKKLE